MKAYKVNQTQTHVNLYQLVNNGKDWNSQPRMGMLGSHCKPMVSLSQDTMGMHACDSPSLQISIDSQKN